MPFVLPLLAGFACNLGSTFTAAFVRRWGLRWGARVSMVLRDVLGIPVWAFGFGLAVLTPGPRLFSPDVATGVAGWTLAAAGGGIILVALATLGRRALRSSIYDTLVQTGLYARVRHPIHAGALLEFAGLGVLRPTWPVVLACGLGVLWLLAQTWLEEADLLQRLPAYRDYMRRVPRFLPRFGAKHSGEEP